MDNNIVEPQTTPESNQVQAASTPKHTGKPGGALVLNTLARIFIIIADVAFIGVMAYLFVLLILNVVGSEVNSLFSIDAIDLGFFEALGMFIWLAVALAAAAIVGFAIAFVKLTDNYYRVLKTAKEDKLNVVLAPWNLVSFIFPVVLVLIVLGILIIGFFQNNLINVTTILVIVSAISLLLALIFSIVYAIINRVKFNKLSDEEKAEVKELSKTFRKKVVKAERKATAGKLY